MEENWEGNGEENGEANSGESEGESGEENGGENLAVKWGDAQQKQWQRKGKKRTGKEQQQ